MKPHYKIKLSKTVNGKAEYLQIISDDAISVNLVLIGKFSLNDQRLTHKQAHERIAAFEKELKQAREQFREALLARKD